MCGIAGIYHLAGEQPVERALLQTMVDSFAYRGPDDDGFYQEPGLGLGFRRLSIIDLASGNQPISNEDDTLVLICNGEIYNYRELQADLIKQGHRFKTACDIEVILHLYEQYGVELLQRLNGQFAFALYDKRQKRLMLARDHVGIAPLFYTVAGQRFIFGSEIKAILKYPAVERRVDLTGLDQIFTFPGLVSPRTLFQNIHALKPGHFILVEQGDVKVKEYWDLTYPLQSELDNQISEQDCIDRLDEALRKAVNYRLHADVPVGFYLSGGLDSSLIAGLIHDLSPEKQRHSFSIGFHDKAIDERHYQQIMAAQVNSIHHETVFDSEHIAERLQDMIFHAETPLKESYNSCSLALSGLVKQQGLKVVLTGEGADELFAGYVGYRLDQNREQDDFSLEAMLETQLQEECWGEPFFYEKNYHEFKDTKRALYASAVLEQAEEFECTNHAPVDTGKLLGRHAIHKRSYLDFKLRMSDHLLADHGDRVAYANSVEARYPFLDVNVIACARTIPPHFLVNNMQEKYILKQLARRYVPDAVINRPKFSFVAPGSPNLLRQNNEWIEDLLSYERIKRQGYFNPDVIERLKKTYRADGFNINQTFDDDWLLMVLTFNIWLEIFGLPEF
ncbi:asparagine synthase (glutamine-hydrolyzing) [Candidatus Methylobacter oryzae]|uniref:asparagine synthase (glutamine-hydrolyzing) n=1 Tax=Candidatus Methylobacter oryzae TaxID=2497749 RepID=A0ABY3C694_9GAMM|nr:asparagine synthase (glutamine-hydrolyzing) [Candidatus Methylobacter oryzae]TRW90373.1 asparagine synthase (glutamine-hydrolyzing) [Candidatus Methylobacter oryzae]